MEWPTKEFLLKHNQEQYRLIDELSKLVRQYYESYDGFIPPKCDQELVMQCVNGDL